VDCFSKKLFFAKSTYHLHLLPRTAGAAAGAGGATAAAQAE